MYDVVLLLTSRILDNGAILVTTGFRIIYPSWRSEIALKIAWALMIKY